MPFLPGQAVLLTCHGTVADKADIPEFVTNIRRGRPAPAEVVDEVTRRFEHIGGSPLMDITAAQAKELERRLGVPVRGAGRLWGPYPDSVVGPLVDAGVQRVVSVPLAPQSVHVYHRFVEKQLAPFEVEVVTSPAYGTEPALIGAFTEAILEAKAAMAEHRHMVTLLTAHSLPLRVIASGDPYQKDFEVMAGAIRDDLVGYGFERDDIHIAYQSQGMGGGDWLGPTVEASFEEQRARGASGLLVAPVGFVAEHVETLYDIDVEARLLAERLGFEEMVRMPAMNTRAKFIDALEAVARPLLESA